MREQQQVARILIADNHQLLADGCKSLLEPEFLVVGTVADSRQVARRGGRIEPGYYPHGYLHAALEWARCWRTSQEEKS